MSAISQDERWMTRALALAARAGAAGEVPVGAVVVVDNREVGAGCNGPIGHCDPTAHAEIQALRSAARRAGNYRLPGATLYVTLEPCTMCVGAIVHGRISRLVFGTTEPKAGAVVSARQTLQEGFLNWRVSVTGGVMADQCRDMIQQFFAERRQAHNSSGKEQAQS